MREKIIKVCSTYTLLLLITAFLTMQWSNTHVHLPEKHNHDGNEHQHQAQLHIHHVIDEANASHVNHQISHANVITFDLEYCFYKQQKPNPFSTALISETPQLIVPLWLVSYNIPEPVDTLLSYFRYSTNHSRAPPPTS